MSSSERAPIPTLVESAASDLGARAALENYRKLKAAGGLPEIWYSDFGGWRIIDPLEIKLRSDVHDCRR